jgi:hypothetical protein
MLAYLEWVLKGVRGIVRDAWTGQPVRAAVRVEGYPHLVFSNPAVGDYHRILLPGTYAIWVTAPGYIPKRIPGVVVGTGPAARADVTLQPASSRFAAKINFQPASAPVPTGFMIDSGAAFGARGGGYSYGWETTLGSANIIARFAARSQDLRYDTFAQMQGGGSHSWEIAVPNGPYSVLLIAGDPAYTGGTYRINAENGLLLSGVPSASNRWVEAVGTVVVTDGRLTFSNGTGALSNRLATVEISALEPATIAQWRALYFGTTNNAGIAADSADPDGDTIPNLLEYALGLNPTNADAQAQLSPLVWSTNSLLWFGGSFRRNTNASDLSLRVQAVSTLSNSAWSEIAARTNGLSWTGPALATETTGTNPVTVTVLDTQPVRGGTNRFMRLRVTAP